MQRGILTLALAAALPIFCDAATFTVEIRNFYFTPTNLVIQPGDTVTWRNTSFTPHDTTHNAPPGSRVWGSPTLTQNETFSHTFTQAGLFRYMCALHVGTFPQQTGTVSVVAANLAPSVQITAPLNGASFVEPASFSVEAAASDSDGTVVSVQFYANGSLLGTSLGPSFSLAVNSLFTGNYTLTAVARDDKGATTTSAPVNIGVQRLVHHVLLVSQSPPQGGTLSVIPPQPLPGYLEGSSVSITALPAEGFAFSGWSGDASGSENPLTIVMQAPRNLIANFTPIATPTFPLATAVSPPGSGTVNVNPAPNAGDGMYVQGTVVTLTALPAVGFAFTNWSGDAVGTSNTAVIVMDGPRSAVANFNAVTLNNFALEVHAEPSAGGTVQVNPPPNAANGRYVEGTTITLTALPSAGYAFSNWSGIIGSSNVIRLNISGDRSVTAHFAPTAPATHEVTLNITPPDGGSVAATPPGSNGVYAAGTHLALAAQPSRGFRFVRWTGTINSTNNPILLVVEEDSLITAEFERSPGLDFASLRGLYAGLLIDATGSNYAASGSVTMRVSGSGSFRGTALIGGIRTPLRGQFDRLGYAPLTARNATLIGSLQIDETGAEIDGFLADPTLTTTATVRLVSAARASTTFAGNYTLMLPETEPVAGAGLLVLNVRADGLVRISGRLGDGTRVLQRTFVSAAGEVPFFKPLYQRRGAILGWIDVLEDSASISWHRPGDSRSADYPTGFSLLITAEIVPE